MYCPKCGNVLENNAMFCPKCGYRINSINSTKEINVGVIKDIAKSSNLNINVSNNRITKNQDNNNIYIILGCGVIIALLIVILVLIINNRNTYVDPEQRYVYCNEHADDEACKRENPEDPTGQQVDPSEYNPMDFSSYEITETLSADNFAKDLLVILKTKEEEGNKVCNKKEYSNLNNKLNKDLSLEYSYTCTLSISYLNKLNTRLQEFYKMTKVPEKVVNAYLAMDTGKGVYANFTGEAIISNSSYIGYLKRIFIGTRIFNDEDKVNKTYARDLRSNFHPKNSTPQDVIVHETGHALDFYMLARKNKVNDLVVDGFSNWRLLMNDWSNQTYSKSTVLEAAENVNKKLKAEGKKTKTVDELRQEISGYAASYMDDKTTPLYAETFAEALVDYLSNGTNAQPLSVEIYNILERDIANLE